MRKDKSLGPFRMKLFTIAGLFAAACGLASAQQVALSLGSARLTRGQSISLDLSLATSGGAQPTALQWTMAYPASAVASVSVTPGAATTAASKNVKCSSGTGKTVCIVFGMDDGAVGNGVLATATLNLTTGTAVSSAPIQVASVAAIGGTDASIPASGTGRLVAIRLGSKSEGSAAATSEESGSNSAPASAATMFNPASSVAGDVCSPGGLASLSGEGFTSQGPQKATSSPLPTSLGGVQVKVNGEAVPLLFASASQVNFQCPQLTPGSPLNVTVAPESGEAIPAASGTMAAAAPSVFTIAPTTQGVIRIASADQFAMPKTEGTPPARNAR